MHAVVRSRSGKKLKRRCAPGARWAAVLLALALGAFACSTPDRRTAEERTADRAIAEQVEAALSADDRIYARHIEVDAKGGVVWLDGWVLTPDESKEATRASAAVPGVRRVVNSIEVKDYFSHQQ